MRIAGSGLESAYYRQVMVSWSGAATIKCLAISRIARGVGEDGLCRWIFPGYNMPFAIIRTAP